LVPNIALSMLDEHSCAEGGTYSALQAWMGRVPFPRAAPAVSCERTRSDRAVNAAGVTPTRRAMRKGGRWQRCKPHGDRTSAPEGPRCAA